MPQIPPIPVRHTWLRKQVWVGVACMLALTLFFVGQAVVQSHVSRPFSMHDEPLSNLGITVCDYYKAFQNGEWAYVCSPLHNVMNATIALYGILIMVSTALAIHALWPGRRLKSLGVAVVFLGGIETVVAGSAPVNLMVVLHNVSGCLALAALNTGLIILGYAAFKTQRVLAWFTLLCGLFGVTSFVMTFMSIYTWFGYGVWLRAAACMFAFWGVCVGLYWLYGLVRGK